MRTFSRDELRHLDFLFNTCWKCGAKTENGKTVCGDFCCIGKGREPINRAAEQMADEQTPQQQGQP